MAVPTVSEPSDRAPLTRSIADYACALIDAVPDERSLSIVRLGFIDCAAVLLAGLTTPVAAVASRYLKAEAGPAQSRLALGSQRIGASQAAFFNAVAAHAIDWDDYAYSNHPSAVLVPTLLAAAEQHGASGMRMAAAYVAGYEVWGNLMRREPDHLHGKGWHPTAVLGPIAATVAAGMIARLDPESMRQAVALSCSLAGGVMANFGTMTKPLHAGRAAQAGIEAIRLVQCGLDAGPAAIESPLGLLSALSPAGRVDLKTPFPTPTDPPLIQRLGLNIKKYPTVGASQRVIDSLLEHLAVHSIDPAEVVEAIPLVSDKHAAVMPFHQPLTALEAKFSLEFVVAASLIRRRVGLAELDDAFVHSAPVQDLMRRVKIETTTETDPGYPNAAPADYVRLRLADGREIVTGRVKRATGHADRPLEPHQLWSKFADCADAAGVSKLEARKLFEALGRVDRWASTDELPSVNARANALF
jgi:2-methylcitrate dehydratase PrpD